MIIILSNPNFNKLHCFFLSICCTSYVYASKDHSTLWSESGNAIMQKIQASRKLFLEQNVSIIEQVDELITKDLKPFSSTGISKIMIENSFSFGTKYQLINHSIYRDKECMFPFRCKGIEHFLSKFTNLSDYEIVINTRDWPQIQKLFQKKLPVFSFSKTDEYYDISYPAWSFWCGGPAISLHPIGIGRWDLQRKSLINTSKKWPWKEKKEIAFFRGSRTSSERDNLVYLSRESPTLVDAAYTKNQAWKSDEDTLKAPPAKEVSFEDHCQYKYLFNFRGVAASFRLKHLFLCRSLVFHVGNEWTEYFYPFLKPWIHYVPVSCSYTKQEVRELIEFFKTHDKLAESIAENGFQFIKNHLKMSDVSYYWNRLLHRYVSILSYQPKLDPNLVKV